MAPGTTTQHRISVGSLLSAAGALLLLVTLFLDWYGSDGGGGASGWETFELVDIVLAGLAVVVLVALVASFTTGGRVPEPPAWLVVAAGPFALVLVLVSLVNDPPLILFAPDAGPEVGIWLALVAALLMTAGTFLGRVRVSIVLSSRESAATVDPAAETRTMPVDDSSSER